MSNLSKLIIGVILFKICFSGLGFAVGTIRTDSTSTVSSLCGSVLKRAIDLNEAFKESVESAPWEDFQRLRSKVESFQQDTMHNIIPECVPYMSKNADTTLAILFFEYVDSYENSADEFISYSAGVFYIYNPKLTELLLLRFNNEKQVSIIDKIKFGLEIIASKKKITATKKDSLIQNLDRLGLR